MNEYTWIPHKPSIGRRRSVDLNENAGSEQAVREDDNTARRVFRCTWGGEGRVGEEETSSMNDPFLKLEPFLWRDSFGRCSLQQVRMLWTGLQQRERLTEGREKKRDETGPRFHAMQVKCKAGAPVLFLSSRLSGLRHQEGIFLRQISLAKKVRI
jgi:hypothetical protein